MALSPDGHLLASVDGAGQLAVWEVPSGRLRDTWTIQQQPRPTESHDILTATPQKREQCTVVQCVACEGSVQHVMWGVRSSVSRHDTSTEFSTAPVVVDSPAAPCHVIVM